MLGALVITYLVGIVAIPIFSLLITIFDTLFRRAPQYHITPWSETYFFIIWKEIKYYVLKHISLMGSGLSMGLIISVEN